MALGELKKNIKILVGKGFHITQFIAHIKDLGLIDKAEFIENKMKVTNEDLIGLFGQFFQMKPKDRPEMEMVVGMLMSLEPVVIEKPIQRSRIKVKEMREIPADLLFMIETKDMFYELAEASFLSKF